MAAACPAEPVAPRPRAEAGGATLLDCSGDGVLSHVLPWLSDEALLAAACASRDWRALVDDAPFGAGLRAREVNARALAGALSCGPLGCALTAGTLLAGAEGVGEQLVEACPPLPLRARSRETHAGMVLRRRGRAAARGGRRLSL